MWALVISAAASVVVCGGVREVLRRSGVWDIPGERSSHFQPTVRGGGLGIVLVLVGWCVVCGMLGDQPGGCGWVVAGTVCLSLLGFWDDVRGHVPIALRLVIEFAVSASVLLCAGMLSTETGLVGVLGPGLAVVLGTFGCVMFMNFFNFIDGIDGYAAGLAAVGAVALGFVSEGPAAQAAFVTAGAAAGFLCWNWHPASVFLGDCGSLALGFLAASAAAMPGPDTGTRLLVAAAALWPVWTDAGWTLLGRMARRENILQPHRKHLYQRLVRSGLSHRRVSTVVISAAAGSAAAAVFAVRFGSPFATAAVATLVVVNFAGLCAWVRVREDGHLRFWRAAEFDTSPGGERAAAAAGREF